MFAEERKEALIEYTNLAKKHDLPSLNLLEKELSVRLEKVPSVPFFIRCLHERISNSIAHLELVLHPSRMADMIETKFHNEDEKAQIFLFYKDAMVHLHEIILAVFTNNKETINCLKKSWAYYIKNVKPFMQNFLKKQIEGWKNEGKEEKFENNYMR